jgi:hypothetical protein
VPHVAGDKPFATLRTGPKRFEIGRAHWIHGSTLTDFIKR